MSVLNPLLCFLIVLVSLAPIAAQKTRRADLVVINAKVRTMTSPDSISEAIAVSGDRITVLGKTSEIKKLAGPTTRVIDAQGRLLLPGFNDSHVHFMGIGNTFSSFDLHGVENSKQVEDRVRRFVRFIPKGRWILGSGWKGEIAPTRGAIDALTPDNPMLIYAPDGLSAFANTAALKAAGVTEDSDTGPVRGVQLRKIVVSMPANHMRNWIEIAQSATNLAASLGVTSVQDMQSDDLRAVYRQLETEGKLRTRIYDCLPLSSWNTLSVSEYTSKNTAMVRGGCLKGFSDGDASLAEKLSDDIVAADKAGLQIMVHAIGSVANGIVLDAFEKAIKANGSRDRRFRAEHAYNPRPTDLARFARSGVISSMQPHLFRGGSGGHYATLLRSKASIAFGSDAAITDLDPLLGIYDAVNAGSEALTVYEAVRAYTFGSAFAEFQEKEKGTIEVGKLADFVILTDDIFSIAVERIPQVKVTMTVVGGRIVFEDRVN